MEGRELRRSYTQMEFPVTKGPRNNYHQQGQRAPSNKRYQQQGQKSKFPTQEIYRPPSQRDPQDPSRSSRALNVHAKEFAPLGSSLPLQSSKSTGNVLVAVNNENRLAKSQRSVGFPLGLSKTTHHQFHQHKTNNNSSHKQESPAAAPNHQKPNQLQRSKSTTSAVPKPIDLSIFGKKSTLVESVYHCPEKMPSSALLELAKLIAAKAQENRSWADSLAWLSFYIIEREKQRTFLESLLNILQYTVEKKCKGGTAGDSFYFSLMSYLHALYCEMKPHRAELDIDGSSPALMLLAILIEVCTDFLRQPTFTSRKEVESLFFVVTTTGRDMEGDCPKQMEQLMACVRDAFLMQETSAQIRRTLLQLIEMRAARWQLSARAVLYYQGLMPIT
ncbi:uncharacterized protein [Halyomorpha halys]|uniref:uncharacterized protein n=1 Tax=Halyomorpha halys TaxID=286706 RepID=UPI0006D4F536|nr:uncharacterized protein LOC106680827 [Halyomorpha halys]